MLLTLSVLRDELTVCRFDAQAEIPVWATSAPFFSITRSADELSIICRAQQAPAGVKQEAGWRALKLAGPFDFAQTGVLASIAAPLAAAGIAILAIATYDTDYILVKTTQLRQALAALQEQGHRII
jgi:uncharacterized protein